MATEAVSPKNNAHVTYRVGLMVLIPTVLCGAGWLAGNSIAIAKEATACAAESAAQKVKVEDLATHYSEILTKLDGVGERLRVLEVSHAKLSERIDLLIDLELGFPQEAAGMNMAFDARPSKDRNGDRHRDRARSTAQGPRNRGAAEPRPVG